MKRITLNITDEQFATLKERAQQTGVLQSEQIRRAIAAALDEPKQPRCQSATPVLFAGRETR